MENQIDLFEYNGEENRKKEEPLAARMRPATLEDYVGQEHIIGKGKLLYRAIKADKIRSLIFYGPPGTGKTTLAHVIANTTSASFRQVNATKAGKKDLEDVINFALRNYAETQKRTILFIDEIHRFNKAQQDYLLPFVENGTVILIGATTENPYFEVNGALLSRSQIFELKPLTKENIITILKNAIEDPLQGIASLNPKVDDDAMAFLADVADGDARSALNALELAILTTEPDEDGFIHITIDVAAECIQKRVIRYDRDGDQHYDTISAFIKSMRGSDPDATLYYLARMLEAGEDIRFIARRIMIHATEDVGNADPMALVIASSAAQAVERVGLPECGQILAQAATYVACAPKSNAVSSGFAKAQNEVKQSGNLPIPNYLKDAHYNSAEKLGRGIGYKYPHDYSLHYVEQQYLPDQIKEKTFYDFTDQAYESKIQKNFQILGKKKFGHEPKK